MTNANEKALLEVNWALQEAYKIAVHHSGITNWSLEKPERKNEVEIMQIKIAIMILSRLWNVLTVVALDSYRIVSIIGIVRTLVVCKNLLRKR